jgi:deoxyribodipyrimidine photo-lyase
MQQAQRAKCNHALEHAIARANELKLPLLVGFGLTDDYPEANLRHYIFMLEGLRETAAALRKRGIKFVLQRGNPASVALRLERRAALIVCDRGYLRLQKTWSTRVARKAKCAVEQVESDVIVPVGVASDKREFAARTLRPKLQRLLPRYLVPLRTVSLQQHSLRLNVSGLDLRDPNALCRRLKLDRSVAPVTQFFRGGTAEAEKIFRKFLHASLRAYARNRNQPQTDDVSHMSKYLHFGQISPLWLALEMEKRKRDDNVMTFLEELIVRRELAMNYVEFTKNYDRFDALPDWARKTLRRHRRDERPVVYSRRQLEEAKTHDRYWNAAMQEMRTTGYLHNHTRMYWGKKILEWSRAPEQAFAVALALNNKWFLDGRDANSFANISWIFGLHDRPWGERPIFGKVRYMNARGLERKCDIEAYVEKVRRLSERSR